jgi:L-ornithine N5-oxygenase
MAPSAISTPTAVDESNRPYSNAILSRNGQMDRIHLNGHLSNGHSNGHALPQSSPDELLDLLCVGFGPASLAIAIALHDICPTSSAPKALFLEKQPQFAWHAGMQLPGAKMQISFMKDLATPRDPRSKFTFINYLFEQERLNQFINLSTFLPTRIEYEDYLRWCASHFEKEGKVAYGMEVEGVRAGEKSQDGKVSSWEVTARDQSGKTVTRRARHVVIAVGGRPVVPRNMQGLKHVAHSSQFAYTIGQIQEKEAGRRLRFAVVGSGQSAAEIFNDLWDRFPDAEVKLIIKGASLRPSDDSP